MIVTQVWPACGHLRTPENAKRVGWTAAGAPKLACLICQRTSTRRAQKAHYRRMVLSRPPSQMEQR